MNELLAVGLVIGASVFLTGAIGGGVIGWALRGWKSPQEAATRRELMTSCKNYERQIDTARDVAGEIQLAVWAHPQTRIEIEQKLLPILTKRSRS